MFAGSIYSFEGSKSFWRLMIFMKIHCLEGKDGLVTYPSSFLHAKRSNMAKKKLHARIQVQLKKDNLIGTISSRQEMETQDIDSLEPRCRDCLRPSQLSYWHPTLGIVLDRDGSACNSFIYFYFSSCYYWLF